MPTGTQVSCRACRRSLEGATRYDFVIQSDGHSWGPIGPVCFECSDYAVERRSGPMAVIQTNPDGARNVMNFDAREP